MSATDDDRQNPLSEAKGEQEKLDRLFQGENVTPNDRSINNDVTEVEGKSAKKSILSLKTFITLAVSAVLIGSISIVTNWLKPPSLMAGMEGMEDMKGMSMEDMMRVDGSANSTPVTVESIKPSLLKASVRYTGTVRPYQEVTVYPRVGGQLTEYTAYPGNQVKAGQVLARLSATELSTEVEEAIAEMEATKAEAQAAREELDEQRQEIERMAAESNYLETRV